MKQSQINIFGVDSSLITTYEGIEGVRTVSRNSLNAKKNLYIYEMSYASLGEIFSQEEAEDMRKQFLSKGIKIREITNQIYDEYTGLKEFHEKCMEIRYLNPEKFNLQTEFLIYDDIVAFYSYKDELFAVEIQCKKFAQTQAEIFQLMWNLAQRPVIGKGGRSSIF
jgi:hypothetical protein